MQLLGSQSNDIDIALENIMGVPFAEHFAAFLSSEKHLPVKDVTKIESNPGQSKHLETARTTVLDTELDFVNLRSEEYAEDSRIPTGVVCEPRQLLEEYNNVNLMIIGIRYTSAGCPTKRYHNQRPIL